MISTKRKVIGNEEKALRDVVEAYIARRQGTAPTMMQTLEDTDGGSGPAAGSTPEQRTVEMVALQIAQQLLDASGGNVNRLSKEEIAAVIAGAFKPAPAGKSIKDILIRHGEITQGAKALGKFLDAQRPRRKVLGITVYDDIK